MKSEVVDGKTGAVQRPGSDSLWTIAQRFGVSVEQVQSWNALGGLREGASRSAPC